ncbi:MAG: hypothetical protein EOM25_12095 [Deltaproteobacteria bacterium]|nr:hypothetical protein [Deltaproteobacteria bacterium]
MHKMKLTKEQERIARTMAETWRTTMGSEWVARTEFGKFSGGAIGGRTVSNLESASGDGPEGAVLMGKRKAYPVDNAAAWLAMRIKPVGERVGRWAKEVQS